MKKFSKFINLGAVSLMTAAIFSGTGLLFRQDAFAAQPYKGKTIKIGVWIGSDLEQTGLNKLIKGFEKKEGAKVTEKVYTNFQTQIQADFSARKAPDVFYMTHPFIHGLSAREF